MSYCVHLPPVKRIPWTRPPDFFYHAQRMEKVGSEIAHRQVPARPIFAAGSYLHANLAWHLGTVCRAPGICVFEARSLIDNAPTWKNDQASCSLSHSRSLFWCSGEEKYFPGAR